jgi:ribosome-associated protein
MEAGSRRLLADLVARGELRFEFHRASGPGGQNVNKVATAVRLRFDLRGSGTLPDDVKERLIAIAGNKVTRAGVLVIEASRFRTQDKNRQDALERLRRLVVRALRKPRRRKPTAPTGAARERRLLAKRRRGATKQARAAGQTDE